MEIFQISRKDLPAPAILSRRSVHAAKLERWLGKEECERISASMSDWYGPPIAVANVPGGVFAGRGGDFSGPLAVGGFGNLLDYAEHRGRRAYKRWLDGQRRTLNAGFASLSDLISEMTAGGKRREFLMSKAGVTGVLNSTNTLWYVGTQPAAGSNAGAAPGGTAFDDSSTGAFPFTNPTGGDTQHCVSANLLASVAPNTLLLYDRLFSVTKTMSSSVTEAVTGVPTRYQSSTPTDGNYAGGNFLMIECRSALSATAHNWTTCTYKDQTGAASTLPSVTGNNSNIQYRLDQPAGTWFCPLEAGDVGIASLTQMQCSSAALTGAIDFTIGHPIAWIPCPVANLVVPVDGINSAFGLARIFDDACLAFLEVCKGATTATNYAGTFTTGAG